MAEQKGSRRILRRLLILVLLIGAGILVYTLFLRGRSTPKNIVELSGRIESDDSAIAAKTAGRLREITVREGDHVTEGQVIAVLDDPQTLAREEQAKSAVQQADARLQRAQDQIGVLNKQLDQMRIMEAQSKLDAQGRVKQAEAQLAAAEATLAQSRATLEQARYDASKYSNLAAQGAEPERTAVQARTTAEAQEAAVKAAQKQVDAYRGALEMAGANLTNPAIRASQGAAVVQQIHQAMSDIDGARADREHAQQQLREAEDNRKDLNIVAPFEGTVAVRSAEPGEVVAAGTPIVTLVNYNQVYLRGYVPEGEIGRVKIGQPARVYLDSDPNHPWEAAISRIDPEASFTPENTYFKNDRVKQVVGVKLLLKNPQGAAKPGMPAEGEILVEGETWPPVKK